VNIFPNSFFKESKKTFGTQISWIDAISSLES